MRHWLIAGGCVLLKAAVDVLVIIVLARMWGVR